MLCLSTGAWGAEAAAVSFPEGPSFMAWAIELQTQHKVRLLEEGHNVGLLEGGQGGHNVGLLEEEGHT